MEASIAADFQSSENLGNCLIGTQCLRAIPYHVVDQALARTDRKDRRLGKFPDHLVVYQTIFMALFMDLSYLHVFERIRNTFLWLSGSGQGIDDISDSAITQARQRLGMEPLRELFKIVARPQATADTPDAYCNDLRVVMIDGTTFDVPDTKANAFFGRRTNSNGQGAFPMVRAVALVEASTRLVMDVELGPFLGSGEVSLAKSIVSRMGSGNLCLADRGFPGTELCKQIIETGSHFLMRVKGEKSITLKPLKKLPDGTHLAHLNQADKDPLTVRVIEYKLEGKKDIYRLITSLLDSDKYSAIELAMLYPHRWEIETFYAEIKNTLRAPKVILRSKNPDTVYQELYGLFLAHYVVRSFMCEAAREAGIPPNNLSFKHSVQVVRRNAPRFGDFFP